MPQNYHLVALRDHKWKRHETVRDRHEKIHDNTETVLEIRMTSMRSWSLARSDRDIGLATGSNRQHCEKQTSCHADTK